MSSAMDKISYSDLYARWERGNWSATGIDFTADREQWHSDFSELERRAALWNYSMFFHGEDAVADDLAPFIDAAPREEQKYFLTTQQVDEARHSASSTASCTRSSSAATAAWPARSPPPSPS